jgi:hypothetical protein
MKLRELVNKLRRRSPAKDGERSGDAVDKAFTTSYEQSASTWIPSQQDRPRH